MQDLWMARPGLEPGTARFSVVGTNLSNCVGIPANPYVAGCVELDPIRADWARLLSIWALEVTSCPIRSLRRGIHRVDRPASPAVGDLGSPVRAT